MSDVKKLNVAIRVRPLSKEEKLVGSYSLVESIENNSINLPDKTFSFPTILTPDVKQDGVFKTCITDMLAMAYKGHNVTTIMYGQTGSGKTYTLGTEWSNVANEESRGIIPRAIEYLFDHLDGQLSLAVTFMEVYNQEVLNLLETKKTRKPIVIRENNNVIQLCGVDPVPVTDQRQALDILHRGCQARATGSTAMNTQSSRSHSIFTLYMWENSAAMEKGVKLHFVDLGGSESVGKSNTKGAQLMEGISINKGLLELGKVISDLAEGKAYVNTRNHVLTRLLKDSLTSHHYTLIIACISPFSGHIGETGETLRFAERALRAKLKPTLNSSSILREANRKIFFTPSHNSRRPTPATRHPPITPSPYPLPAPGYSPVVRRVCSLVEDKLEDLFHKYTSDATGQKRASAIASSLRTLSLLNLQRASLHPLNDEFLSMDENLENSYEEDKENVPSRKRRASAIASCIKTQALLNPKAAPHNAENGGDHHFLSPKKRKSTCLLRNKENSGASLTPKPSLLDKEEGPPTLPGEARLSLNLTPPLPMRRSRRESAMVANLKTKLMLKPSSSRHNSAMPEFKQPLLPTPSTRPSKTREEPKRCSKKSSVVPFLIEKGISHKKHCQQFLEFLNTASFHQLQSLPMVGTKTACIIYNWRSLKGKFKSIRDLQNVKGLSTHFYDNFAQVNLVKL